MFERYGTEIGAYFESLFTWEIRTNLFNFSGRDFGWLLIGFLICLILWGMLDGRRIGRDTD